MRLFALAIAAGAAIAAYPRAASAEDAQRVLVTVQAVKGSGKAQGEPTFDDRLAAIKARLQRHFPGYAHYDRLERQANTVAVKAPVAFNFAVGTQVRIVVSLFDADRCLIDIEIHHKGQRVGGMLVRARPGSYNYAAVSKSENEIIVVAFTVDKAPESR